jgi:polyhydroxybutyrate depolymerase
VRGDAPNLASLPAGSHTVSLRHEGRERPYLLHVPPSALTERVPLLLELHGRGIDPLPFDRWTGFRHLADRAGFVVALPSAVGEIWNDGRYPALARDGPRDVGYLVALIEDACTRLPIDVGRIYVVGMSNGATMAARLASEQARRIAAFAQVAGTAAVGVAANRRPACPVPILQIHGTSDDTAPYGGGRRRGLRARLIIRRVAGPSIGVDDWARFWVEANDAHEGPRIETLPPDTTVRRWRGKSSASDVVFYRVEGGGHTWPGNRQPLPRLLFGRTSGAFDATKVIWDFLSAHRREA